MPGGWYPWFGCPSIVCGFCLPKVSPQTLGVGFQAEVTGIAPLPGASLPLTCAPRNGTYALDDGFGLTGETVVLQPLMCNGMVNYDPDWVGSHTFLCADMTSRSACAFYADHGIAAAFYGTLGGGLSCVVGIILPQSWMAYGNAVVSADSRRIDCETLDFTVSSFATMAIAPFFFSRECEVPSSIRITAV